MGVARSAKAGSREVFRDTLNKARETECIESVAAGRVGTRCGGGVGDTDETWREVLASTGAERRAPEAGLRAAGPDRLKWLRAHGGKHRLRARSVALSV